MEQMRDPQNMYTGATAEKNSAVQTGKTAYANGNKVPNVPPLRFPEFTGEWIKVKLNNIVERVRRKNKFNDTELPLTISAQHGLVDQITFFNKKVASQDLSNYYLLKKGEFAYNKSYSSDYPWGAIKRLDKYSEGALSSLYICFAPTKIYSDFLVHYFESPKWYREISDIAGEGARNHGLLNIGIDDFFNTIHWKPNNIDEQKKIARFLNLIEQRIATQSKIIDKLQSLMCGICERLLYSDTGENVKLGDILSERVEKTTENNQYEILSSTVKGIFLQRDYFSKDIASENNIGYKVVRLNDIVLSPQNLWMGNINFNDKFQIGAVSPSYKIFTIADRFYKPFIAAILKTHRALYNYELVSEQGASIVRRNLNMEAFEQLAFKIPSYDRQVQVGNTISTLQQRIDFTKKSYSALMQQKQYLLQRMFI